MISIFNDPKSYCEDMLCVRYFGKCFIYDMLYSSVKDTISLCMRSLRVKEFI